MIQEADILEGACWLAAEGGDMLPPAGAALEAVPAPAGATEAEEGVEGGSDAAGVAAAGVIAEGCAAGETDGVDGGVDVCAALAAGAV